MRWLLFLERGKGSCKRGERRHRVISYDDVHIPFVLLRFLTPNDDDQTSCDDEI